ncbi:MAG: hypothetical protein LBF04_07135 [Prevotellaceae bacterium]|jgi:hypothetical protein|nr:hypothetical protein [Prevotellaceae bacterium]
MKGINFTEPLFHKVVRGKKTQTRLIMNPQPAFEGEFRYACPIDADGKLIEPLYKIGETVYIKEPYFIIPKWHEYKNWVIYKYGEHPEKTDTRPFVNPRIMPAKYARHFIKITCVRCERLQEISDADCLKEGIEEQKWEGHTGKYFYIIPDMTCPIFDSGRKAYAYLIDSIYGKGTWESNPIVWAYDFKLITKYR